MITVNNATYVTLGPVLQSKPEDIQTAFAVSVVGPILLLQEAYPNMPKFSRVINIGSVSSKMGFNPLPIYAAAKAAMDQLTFSLAREVNIHSLFPSMLNKEINICFRLVETANTLRLTLLHLALLRRTTCRRPLSLHH